MRPSRSVGKSPPYRRARAASYRRSRSPRRTCGTASANRQPCRTSCRGRRYTARGPSSFSCAAAPSLTPTCRRRPAMSGAAAAGGRLSISGAGKMTEKYAAFCPPGRRGSRTEQPRVLALVAHAGEIGADAAGADLVERHRQRPCRRGGNRGFERGKGALAVGLTERNKPHAGGDPVGRLRVQERVKRSLERDAVAGAGDADGDRQRDRPAAGGGQTLQRRAGPGRLRSFQEGAALRRGFQKTLLGRSESSGKRSDRRERRLVSGRGGTVGVNEEYGIAEACAFADHHRKPAQQGLGVGHIAGLDRPFDAAGIGESSGGKGRREPRHQPVERGTTKR